MLANVQQATIKPIITAAVAPGTPLDKLPLYFGFFQFAHDARRRGNALLSTLVAGLVA